MSGRIIKAISSFYYVKEGKSVTECKARGHFKKENQSLLVGDIVEYDREAKIIEAVNDRKNSLVRPPVANIDKAFIVSSYSTPSPSRLIIDTLIAICEYKGITPVIVFNKSDLGDFEQIKNCYTKAGYKTIVTSAQNGEGIAEIKAELKDQISVFTGNSGVGKSSLLNIILPELNLKTGQVSEKLGRGRHTTRHTQLYEVQGGLVADTPGFSSLEVEKDDYNFKEQLENCFIEFEEYLGQCKFTGCSHTGEKGCAVCKAVEDGKIEKSRFESYKSIYEELKNLKKWQIK